MTQQVWDQGQVLIYIIHKSRRQATPAVQPAVRGPQSIFLQIFDDQPCRKLSRSQARTHLFESHPACCLQCHGRIVEAMFHKISCCKNHVEDCRECYVDWDMVLLHMMCSISFDAMQVRLIGR